MGSVSFSSPESYSCTSIAQIYSWRSIEGASQTISSSYKSISHKEIKGDRADTQLFHNNSSDASDQKVLFGVKGFDGEEKERGRTSSSESKNEKAEVIKKWCLIWEEKQL